MFTIRKSIIRFLSFVFNKYFDLYTGGRQRPVFFDIDQTSQKLRILERNFDSIRAEVDELLNAPKKLKRYHEIDALQFKISAVENPQRSWKVFMLYMMGEFSSEALTSCPQTCSLLKQIPGIYQCFFSILDAQKNIPAHNGSYRGYLRYHLGLKVPTTNPPFIRIKDQFYTWTESGSILFDDSWNHQVTNECNSERIILVVDIYRPLPRVPAKVNYLLSHHLIKKFYAEKILEKISTETSITTEQPGY
ncbi:MAG: aspartyl/asparaginyl beta-hydroxylase domain-containing protein [Chitinophagales bacterium]